MGWDGFPETGFDGTRRTPERVLREELHPDAVAVHVNLRAGVAYVAVPSQDGHVRPWYYLADKTTSAGETLIEFKCLDIAESPRRWPGKVASAITRWD